MKRGRGEMTATQGDTRTLYHWSRMDGRISTHTARWLPEQRAWLEEYPDGGWTRMPDGFWYETPAEAWAAGRAHFLAERRRIDDALTSLVEQAP